MCISLFCGIIEEICGKWFETGGISYLFSMIIRVRVVFRETVVVD